MVTRASGDRRGNSGAPVQLVAMQELLPEDRSMATGISYSMSTGSIAAMIGVGVLGDAPGLRAALVVAALIALVARPAILLLPDTRRREGPRSGHAGRR